MKAFISRFIIFFCTIFSVTILAAACMRIEPTHPYDPESPPEYRAPASLVSALYSAEIPQDYDFRAFSIELSALDFDGLYTRQPDSDGRFRFEGIPPGVYILSIEGQVDGILYGVKGEEIFLPAGEKLDPPYYLVSPLE